FTSSPHTPSPHSFPTRRSSDLVSVESDLMPSIEKRIHELRDEINRHSHLYYVESRPTITDRDFDKLLQELIDLEKAHPDLVTPRSEEHTSELQSRFDIVCRLLL